MNFDDVPPPAPAFALSFSERNSKNCEPKMSNSSTEENAVIKGIAKLTIKKKKPSVKELLYEQELVASLPPQESTSSNYEPTASTSLRSYDQSTSSIDSEEKKIDQNEIREMTSVENFTNNIRKASVDAIFRRRFRKTVGFNGAPMKEGVELYKHQIDTVLFMKNVEKKTDLSDIRTGKVYPYGMRGGLISLSMGLGKTLCALVYSLISRRKGDLPTLIVCSKTVLYEWKRNIEKFFDTDILRVIYFHKTYMKVDYTTRETLLNAKFVITTYDLCSSVCKKFEYNDMVCEKGTEGLHKGKIIDIFNRTRDTVLENVEFGPALIYDIPWKRIICDESQRFINNKSFQYKAMMALYGEKKWCMTGTPIRNGHVDLWAQLRFLGYKYVAHAKEWKVVGIDTYRRQELKQFVITLKYSDTDIVIPEKEDIIIRRDLSVNEQIVYDNNLRATREIFKMMLSNACSFSCVLAQFTRLRQTCIAPYLSKSGGDGSGTLDAWLADPNGTAGSQSTKINAVIDILKQEPGKVLIFSTFSSCLLLIAKAVETQLSERVLLIDGDCIGGERDATITRFKTRDDCRILLMTYKVGSEGLTLTEATTCICVDPWWNNSVHEQAKARCWRIGQKNKVKTFFIKINDTIEEAIHDLCFDKDRVSDAFMGSDVDTPTKVIIGKVTMGKILGYYGKNSIVPRNEK